MIKFHSCLVVLLYLEPLNTHLRSVSVVRRQHGNSLFQQFTSELKKYMKNTPKKLLSLVNLTDFVPYFTLSLHCFTQFNSTYLVLQHIYLNHHTHIYIYKVSSQETSDMYIIMSQVLLSNTSVTNISFYLLVLLNTLQLAAGVTGHLLSGDDSSCSWVFCSCTGPNFRCNHMFSWRGGTWCPPVSTLVM